MRPIEKWIWLPHQYYPDRGETYHTCLGERPEERFTVVSFSRTYAFKQSIRSVSLRFSGDSSFRLYLKQKGETIFLAAGPASAGGDFLFNEQPRPISYAFLKELTCESPDFGKLLEAGELSFYAEVVRQPNNMYEFSRGHGGFMLTANVYFEDGTETVIMTDETWTAQLLSGYDAECHFDDRHPDEPTYNAEVLLNRWFTEDAPIESCTETLLFPGNESEDILVSPGEKKVIDLPFDMIYAGYLGMKASAPGGPVYVKVRCYETEEKGEIEEMVFSRPSSVYRGAVLHSAGGMELTVDNRGSLPARIQAFLITSHYPVSVQAHTLTSDPELNRVLDVCAHTLKYCRQTLHLDSPRHCEPLACTGDYYIESMMTAFTFGDQRLSAFDVRRTAENLRYHDGRMFHTSYSLIWVQMLWEIYQMSGDHSLLQDCEDALILLLERFASYIGGNGLLETPPDYMFIDWLDPDGISMHHPPKALGQTCLCMFYYGALKTAARIFTVLGKQAMAEKNAAKARELAAAIIRELYDPQQELFFEGLNTPTPEELLAYYMPQNVEKRYYRRHANILAAYFGVLEQKECIRLLRKILKADELGPVQPYFMHFWLEAVYRNGLREEMTLPLLELWKAPVRECPKGLAEGFYKPEPTYRFDHSHAWGGTPAYSLPQALSGLQILEPGYRKIRLSPSLLGLDFAKVEIPTPFGLVILDMNKNRPVQLTVPDGIEVIA